MLQEKSREEEPLISPSALKQKWPLNPKAETFINTSRETIKNILNGQDPRLLLILGPCSIQGTESCLDFAKKLKLLSDQYGSQFFIVMRTYFEKARTITDWKGFLYDPEMNGASNINLGLEESRKILVELAHLEIATATEFLHPATPIYLSDLISWGCIGARTSESQIHREIASGLQCPVSFKNSTTGDIKTAIKGIISSACSQSTIGISEEGCLVKVTSKGNPNCHLTLRGSEFGPNYDPDSIAKTLRLLKDEGLKEILLIDCSHGNSNRQAANQPIVFQSVIHQIIEGNTNIKGVILEVELQSGNQPIPKDLSKLKKNVSVTDPCIDLEMTEALLRSAFKKLEKQGEERILNLCQK